MIVYKSYPLFFQQFHLPVADAAAKGAGYITILSYHPVAGKLAVFWHSMKGIAYHPCPPAVSRKFCDLSIGSHLSFGTLPDNIVDSLKCAFFVCLLLSILLHPSLFSRGLSRYVNFCAMPRLLPAVPLPFLLLPAWWVGSISCLPFLQACTAYA